MSEQQITAQEIFDKVADHLATQKVQSRRRNPARGDYLCLYRGPNGTQCAFGIFIPDEFYHTSMEGYQSNSILRSAERRIAKSHYGDYAMESVVGDKFVEVLKPLIPHRDLIAQLQRAHDTESGPQAWGSCLAEVARHFAMKFDRLAFEDKLLGVTPQTCTCSAQPMTPHAEECPVTQLARQAFANSGQSAEGDEQ